MARLFTSGAELGHVQAEGFTTPGAGGAPTFETTIKRTGVASLKSAAVNQYGNRALTTVLGRTYYFRFYYQFSNNPTALHRPFTTLTSGIILEMVNTTRVLRILNLSATTLATGTTVLNEDTWYRIEVAVNVPAAGNGTVELKIDGNVEIASASYSIGNSAITGCRFGFGGNAGGITALYFDDMAINDDQGSDQNSYPGAGSVYALLPAADPQTGTAFANWTKPGGATTARHTSVDNVPPIYIADSTAAGDAEKMLRNPTNAASNLELDLTDYTTAGVPSGETIVLVQPIAGTGSSSATDTSGGLELVSNPAVTSKAITAFDNGIASTTATTWPRAEGNIVYNPTVTRGTQPRIRLARAATARTVMTNMLGLLVESQAGGTTWDGVSAVTTSYAVSTAGAREADGASSATTSYAIATAGERTATGVVTLATSYAVTTAGERTATGASSIATSYAISTAGIDEKLGTASAVTSFSISTAGAKEKDGATAAVTSFLISTAGVDEKLGVSAAVTSFAITTAASREATGVVARSVTFAIVTAAAKEKDGAAAAVTSFSISTAGAKEKDGASSAATSFLIATAGIDEKLGVSSATTSFSIATAAAREAAGVSGLGAAFSISTSAERTATGVVARPVTFTIVTAAERTATGAASATTTFTVTTAGDRTATGVVSRPVTFTISTDAHADQIAVVALAVAFSIFTDGELDGQDKLGVVELPIEFAISTSSTREATGVSSLPFSYSLVTAGTRDVPGVVSRGVSFTVSTTGERTATGASSVHAAFTVATTGARETFGQVDLSYSFTIDADGATQVNAIDGEAALTVTLAISSDGQRGRVPDGLRAYRMIYKPFRAVRSAPTGAAGRATPKQEQGAKTVA
jgi:hypothetical protein